MPPIIRKLPPRPNTQAAMPQEVEKKLIAADTQKAIEFKVTLMDGTVLMATGDHAADVYCYLMDCERYCASRPGTVMNYMGPRMIRYDSNGAKIG